MLTTYVAWMFFSISTISKPTSWNVYFQMPLDKIDFLFLMVIPVANLIHHKGFKPCRTSLIEDVVQLMGSFVSVIALLIGPHLIKDYVQWNCVNTVSQCNTLRLRQSESGNRWREQFEPCCHQKWNLPFISCLLVSRGGGLRGKIISFTFASIITWRTNEQGRMMGTQPAYPLSTQL